jgi:hypothetical protein
MVGEFGIKKLVLNIFFPSSIYRSILMEIGGGDGVVNNRL